MLPQEYEDIIDRIWKINLERTTNDHSNKILLIRSPCNFACVCVCVCMDFDILHVRGTHLRLVLNKYLYLGRPCSTSKYHSWNEEFVLLLHPVIATWYIFSIHEAFIWLLS